MKTSEDAERNKAMEQEHFVQVDIEEEDKLVERKGDVCVKTSSEDKGATELVPLRVRDCLITCRWMRSCPILLCMVLFVVLLTASRQVGRSSEEDMSKETQDDRDIRLAADEIVNDLLLVLKEQEQVVIVSTAGSNGVGMKAVRAALSGLGLVIPPVYLNKLTINVNGSNVHFPLQQLLSSTLTPEIGWSFDQQTVVDASSLRNWHLGRAFVASLLNETTSAVPEQGKATVWSISHSRSAYLLPYFKTILGADNFKFVHVVSNPLRLSAEPYEEFRHICKLVRGSSLCENNSINKLNFWATVNRNVFNWAHVNLDVDQYVVARSEDFIEGRKECVRRVGKAVGLTFEEDQLDDAVLKGKAAYDQIISAVDESISQIAETAQQLPLVQEQLEFFGYDDTDLMNDRNCEKMSWS